MKQWNTNDLFCHDLPSRPQPEIGKVLVTGAAGYVGGRLVPELLARGYRVRVMVRGDASEYAQRWPNVEVVVADALALQSLEKALEGIHTAYYLIHSLLLGPKDFEEMDIRAAVNFRKAAEKSEVKRIIYLGSLGDPQRSLSPHLRNRMKVGQELKRGKVPTTILRAAIVIGSGSASYEIIKHLVKNAPILPMPHLARTRCQPIAIRDVIKYLVGVLEISDTSGRSFDIGGKSVLAYREMIKIQADLFGKKVPIISLPFFSIPFHAYLLSLLTPVPVPIIRCLLEGLKDDVVCEENQITRYLPFQPIPYKEAILRALSREEQDNVHTRWSDAYPPAHELAIKLREMETPPEYTSAYSLLTEKDTPSLFRSICDIGGRTGWFHSNPLWAIRGTLDRLLEGVGISRGRRASGNLRINDVIDFWRVEDLKDAERLLLRAEMKLPGKAWLEFRIDRKADKRRLSVKAYFHTDSFWGKLYWYAFLPFHVLIFTDLIREIEKRS